MSMVFYAEFPFDNVCVDEEAGKLNAIRFFKAKALGVNNDQIYMHCDQSVSVKLLGVFFGKSISRDTMFGKQQRIVQVYGVLVLLLTIILVLVVFGEGVVKGTYHLFYGNYKPESEASDIHFTSCPDIQAYIPVISHPTLPFPLVAADVTTFDPKYLAFELPKQDLYHVQSLYNKNELPGFTEQEMKALFSEVRFFPPPEDLEEIAPPKAGGKDGAAAASGDPMKKFVGSLGELGSTLKDKWFKPAEQGYDPVQKE
jgi:hypothetical protein